MTRVVFSFDFLTPNRMEPFQFHSPTSIAIFAPPYSGKSTLMRKSLEHADKLFVTPPEFLVYYYKEWLPMFEEMKHSVKNLILHQGVPTQEEMEQWAQGKTFLYWCWMIYNKSVKKIKRWQKCLQLVLIISTLV